MNGLDGSLKRQMPLQSNTDSVGGEEFPVRQLRPGPAQHQRQIDGSVDRLHLFSSTRTNQKDGVDPGTGVGLAPAYRFLNTPGSQAGGAAYNS
jgi:hypothetical protein